MSKFRQRPIVIDAVQFFPDKRPWPDGVEVSSHPKNPYFVRTVQGAQNAFPGDWIITGVKGELYPCKPDIFELAFEPADGATPLEYKLRLEADLREATHAVEAALAACRTVAVNSFAAGYDAGFGSSGEGNNAEHATPQFSQERYEAGRRTAVAEFTGPPLARRFRCPRCQLTYGANSDSTVAHRERGLVMCLACTKIEER